MFTRKQYLDNECSHRGYYSQFVTPYIKTLVFQTIGIESLLNSKDEHLNDIPLKKWDTLSGSRCNVLSIAEYPNDNKKYYCLSTGVCILKEAAKQIIEEHRL